MAPFTTTGNAANKKATKINVAIEPSTNSSKRVLAILENLIIHEIQNLYRSVQDPNVES